MAAYSIETWLRGMVDYDIPDATLIAILFNNGVAQGSPMSDVEEREREVVDRAGLVKRAQELYAKWNSEKAKTAVGNKITFKSIY